MRTIFSIAAIIIVFTVSCCYAGNNNLSVDLQKLLMSSLHDHSAPGVVMLVSNKKIGSLKFAAGEANLKNHTLMKPSDTFRIASMSKTFIAAAILILEDEGKLKITDLISNFMPENIMVKEIPNGEKLTIQDLLQMRSGVPDYYQSDEYNALFSNDMNHIVTANEAVATLYHKASLFLPGEKYNYSNSNYVLLQIIIENVTKKSLSKALNELIIFPLHLAHTYIADENNFSNNNDHSLTTHGYTLNDKHTFIDVTKKYDGIGLGDGCVVTDLADLRDFLQALLEYKTLVSTNALKEMLHFVDDYGLGISAERTTDGVYYTHNGDASGYSGQYYIDNENTIVIILTNSDETQFLETLSDKVYQRL